MVNEVKRQDADDRVIYIAYSMASARKLHRLHPEAMISLSVNSQSELNRAVAAGIPADRLLGFTGIEDPRPRLFNLLNDRDVEVIFGTLGGRDAIDKEIERSGDEERYAEIARQGVDVLATDRPIEAHKALVEAGVAPQPGACGVIQRLTGMADKTALIIGAGDGLGSALAKAFAAEGLTICMTRRARHLDRLEALAAEITQSGGKAHAFGVDARIEDEMIDLFAKDRK